MRTSLSIADIPIMVDVLAGTTALTIYGRDGQLPPARERAIVQRVRAILGDRLPRARVIVRLGDAGDRRASELVPIIAAAIRETVAPARDETGA
jgi:hypothetical protein